MTLPALAALAMLASSLWMAIGPQLPAFRTHRGALATLTWLGTRALALLVALQAHSPAARDLAAVAGQGLAAGGAAAGPLDAAAGGAWLALLLAADFTAWRVLAAEGGEGGEASWSWAASPLVPWAAIAWGAPRVAVVALLALAYGAQQRGRERACGAALGAAAAWGGPAALAVALALGLAPGRRLARLPGALLAAGAVCVALRVLAPAVTWLPAAVPGGGATLWRLVRAYPGFVPGAWAWLPCALVVLAGFALLARRGAGGAELAAWAFGAFALLAPEFPVRWALLFAPLLGAWAAADPDRRGWWFIESLALALAVVLERPAFGGAAPPVWRLIGIAGVAGAVVLGPWPLAALLRHPVAPGAAPAPR